jgi:hypothetical protein
LGGLGAIHTIISIHHMHPYDHVVWIECGDVGFLGVVDSTEMRRPQTVIAGR